MNAVRHEPPSRSSARATSAAGVTRLDDAAPARVGARRHLPMPMRYPALLTLLLLLPSLAAARGFVRLGEMKLYRVKVAADTGTSLRAYIEREGPKGPWRHKVTVEVFPKLDDPTAFLSDMVGKAIVSSGSMTDKGFVFGNAMTGTIRPCGRDRENMLSLTFKTSPDQPEPDEWNLVRARYVNKVGLVVCHYGIRLTGDKESRRALIDAEIEKIADAFAAATFDEEQEPNPPPAPTAKP